MDNFAAALENKINEKIEAARWWMKNEGKTADWALAFEKQSSTLGPKMWAQVVAAVTGETK